MGGKGAAAANIAMLWILNLSDGAVAIIAPVTRCRCFLDHEGSILIACALVLQEMQ